MTRYLTRFLLGIVLLCGAGSVLPADPKEPAKPAVPPEFSEYRTVETALTTRISRATPAPVGQSGYLGITVNANDRGQLAVAGVEPDSPAAKAGVQPGDALLRVDGRDAGSAEVLRGLLQSRSPGEALKLALLRKDKPLELTATLGATSRPMTMGTQRIVFGVQLGDTKDDGVVVDRVSPFQPAAAAGIRTGDVVLSIDGIKLNDSGSLTGALAGKKPGDVVTVALARDGKKMDLKVTLAGDDREGRGFGWDSTRGSSPWRKDVYRLAVVCVEYPDAKHNAKITRKDWEESLFSRNSYVNKKNVTGQAVHGSLNDYYHELSCGAFRVEGKVFDWVEVGKKRGDYAQGTGTSNRTALLSEALDKLLARDGKEALKSFDGLFFVYAGDRFRTSRGGIYWPHRATVFHQGKRWPYFICPEGGGQMNSISVVCHEFGHMLGLPDLYARPENPGSEGVGAWCAMSNQAGGGRPQHFSAWCKEQLGWVKPAVIDPTVKQKLILSPVEGSPKECFKVLVRADGSEYLLLENRRKKGFDQSLPAEGLLIWRVVNNRPILEESHGVDGPSGPRVFAEAVPYPSAANNAFTPYTTPSSRSQLGGGLPVHITNIRRLADGRITFHIGYEYQ